MSLISVFVKPTVGKLMTVMVDRNGAVLHLRQKIIERNEGGCDYLVLNGRLLKDESLLQEYGIQANSTVNVLMRMHGGGLVDRETLFNVICGELESALNQVPHSRNECDLCYEDKPCIHYCHSDVCDACMLTMCKTNDFRLTCLTCNARKSIGEMITSLKPYASEYNSLLELLRNVDVQLCRCGTVMLNTTMRSHALCSRCGLRFCFFCRSDWDQLKMRDEPYKCSNNCDGITALLRHELVRFGCSTAGAQLIPNRRPCPKCWTLGAYDLKCKYHTCSCGHVFCFMCMKSETDCKAAGGSYGSRCDIRDLKPTDAPRLVPIKKDSCLLF